jgi:hypothetical protein
MDIGGSEELRMHEHRSIALAGVIAAGLLAGSSVGAIAQIDEAASASPTRQPCPNPYGGGACLGPLEPGTYETSEFWAPFSYTVPEGWANYEDEPGNFLLVPPGGTLDGVDAGTSDYIGVYMGVNVASADCVEEPAAGVGHSPEAMTAALAGRPGLIVTEPMPVEVGGLSGRMIDIARDPASDAGCHVPDLDEPLLALIIGAGPASLHHAQMSGFTTRLYVLDLVPSSNVVIEISDVADSPGETADYEDLVSDLVFTGRER